MKLIVWNGASRQSENSAGLREKLASASGMELVSAEQFSELLPRLQNGQSHKYSAIIAAGGDGTIHQVANQMLQAGIELPLGIIPLGTGNDLCRSFGIPLEPEIVATQLIENRFASRRIDVIELRIDEQEVYCLNVLASGVSAKLSETITTGLKEQFGSFAYFSGLLSLLTTPETYEIRYRLNPEKEWRTHICLNFFLANARMCGGGVEVSPGSEPDDGLLEFIRYRPMSSIDRAVLLTDYLVGRYEEHPAICIETFREFELSSVAELPLSVDGEIFHAHRLTAKVLPGRLEILLPDAVADEAA